MLPERVAAYRVYYIDFGPNCYVHLGHFASEKVADELVSVLKSINKHVVTTIKGDKFYIEGLLEDDVDHLFVNEHLTESLKDVVYSVDEALNRFAKKISPTFKSKHRT